MIQSTAGVSGARIHPEQFTNPLLSIKDRQYSDSAFRVIWSQVALTQII